MNSPDPYELLFGGMEKLGPGSNEDTLKVLGTLPNQEFRQVIDAGCGSGRQTLALAKALKLPIHAVDLFEVFLSDLIRRAKEQNLDQFIQIHKMDMIDIPKKFNNVDLIWSEGSAYNIGFQNALKNWMSALKPGGFLVVSEISWIRDQIPGVVRDFFKSEYPEMKSFDENKEIVKKAGYKILNTHVLQKEAWREGFYDVLKPRAVKLINHENESVRNLAEEMQKEISVFENSENSYAYTFFVLQR